jgi:hypothetical protein
MTKTFQIRGSAMTEALDSTGETFATTSFLGIPGPGYETTISEYRLDNNLT